MIKINRELRHEAIGHVTSFLAIGMDYKGGAEARTLLPTTDPEEWPDGFAYNQVYYTLPKRVYAFMSGTIPTQAYFKSLSGRQRLFTPVDGLPNGTGMPVVMWGTDTIWEDNAWYGYETDSNGDQDGNLISIDTPPLSGQFDSLRNDFTHYPRRILPASAAPITWFILCNCLAMQDWGNRSMFNYDNAGFGPITIGTVGLPGSGADMEIPEISVTVDTELMLPSFDMKIPLEF